MTSASKSEPSLAPPRSRTAESLIDADGRLHRGWLAVFTSVICLALGPSVILLMCFGVFVPLLHREFGWSIGAISWGATLVSLSMMVLSPIQGLLVDRFGTRAVVLVSMPLFAGGVALLYFLPSDVHVFYAACASLAVLSLGVWPLSFMRLTSTWFEVRLGFALGVTMVGAGLGAAVLPLLLGQIFEGYGWRGAYVSLGALILFFVWPLAWRFLREGANGARGRSEQTMVQPGLAARDVIRERTFWTLAGAYLFLGVVTNGLLVHQVSMLIDHGFTHGRALQMQSLLGGASIAGRLLAGWLLDRVRLSRLMPILMLCGVAACLVYSADVPVAFLTLSALIVGAVVGAEFDVLAYAIRRYHGLRSFGSVYGWIFAVFQLGSAIGAGALGYMRNAAGSYAIGMLTFAALFGITALLFSRFGAYRFQAASH